MIKYNKINMRMDMEQIEKELIGTTTRQTIKTENIIKTPIIIKNNNEDMSMSMRIIGNMKERELETIEIWIMCLIIGKMGGIIKIKIIIMNIIIKISIEEMIWEIDNIIIIIIIDINMNMIGDIIDSKISMNMIGDIITIDR